MEKVTISSLSPMQHLVDRKKVKLGGKDYQMTLFDMSTKNLRILSPLRVTK